MEDSSHGTSDHDVDSLGTQRTLVVEHRTISRNIENQVIALPTVGEVLSCVVDDVVSTGRTLEGAARALLDQGPASVSVLVTHALFVDDAVARLRRAGVENIWSCDSIAHPTNAVALTPLLGGALGQLLG